MNSTLKAGYAGSNDDKGEDVEYYTGPFEYIKQKCSECPKAERCMLSVEHRLWCLGPVRNSGVTAYKGIALFSAN